MSDKMHKQAHILIVDDDADILQAGKMLLKRVFACVSTLAAPEAVLVEIDKQPPDVILLDMNFGPGKSTGDEGLYWLERIRAVDPDAVVIMITAHGGIDTAVQAMKRGATDFITKPWHNEKLIATVSAGVALRSSRREAARLRTQADMLAADGARPEQPIIGRSQAMRSVLSLIEQAAPTDANVLILGENGTGKELVARALHRASRRAGEIFMSVDLGAIPESLFESELFGHRRGAFTDAKKDRTGRFEAASGGTLFLDEIGNLPLHLQTKLLSVLERRQIVPVGSDRATDIDVRVIAATNMPAEQLADPTVFRSDLLFRLNTVEINLPPLRARTKDIADLVRHYLQYYEKKYAKPNKPVADSVMEELGHYRWPGNVRALRHAVERAVILSKGATYDAGDFSLPETARAAAAHLRADAEMAESEDLNLERRERMAIEAALKKSRFNISHAAKELGLTRAALYRRMEKYGL